MKKLLLIILAAGLFSCTAEAPKTKLNRTERGIIDSLYSNQIPELDSIMDSICVVRRDRDFQRLKDSIIAIRLKEIEAIRKQ